MGAEIKIEVALHPTNTLRLGPAPDSQIYHPKEDIVFIVEGSGQDCLVMRPKVESKDDKGQIFYMFTTEQVLGDIKRLQNDRGLGMKTRLEILGRLEEYFRSSVGPDSFQPY